MTERRATCPPRSPTASSASPRSARSLPASCTATAPAKASASTCRCSRPWRASCSATISAASPTIRRWTRAAIARHLAKDRRPYATADGFISVIVYNDKQWKNFFDAIERDDLRNDPRFATFHGRLANIDHVYGELGRIIKTRTTAEWLDFFVKADIPVMPVHSLTSILDDPHLKAVDFFQAVEHPTEGQDPQHAALAPAGRIRRSRRRGSRRAAASMRSRS